jgi:Ca2+-binding RTX toxin-like protein
LLGRERQFDPLVRTLLIVQSHPEALVAGLGGDDVILGLSGNDIICGGGGNDVINAMGGSGQQLYGDLLAGKIFDDHPNGDEADGALKAIANSYYDIMESSQMKQWLLDHGYDAFTVREYPGQPVSLAVMDPSALHIIDRKPSDQATAYAGEGPAQRIFKRGDRVFFEYHCLQDEESQDAELWHHTRQWARVARVMRYPEVDHEADPVYELQFDDGFRAQAQRDEVTAEPVPEPEKRGVIMPRKSRGAEDKACKGYMRTPVGTPRQRSFCKRMCGMRKKNTGAKTASDPNSCINQALRRWKCRCH